MNPKQSELLNILKNPQIPYEEKFGTEEEIAMHFGFRKFEAGDIPQVYKIVVEFWRSLAFNEIDRNDEGLFAIRNKVANDCLRLSLQLPKGQKFFRYYPRLKMVEGCDNKIKKIFKSNYTNGYFDIFQITSGTYYHGQNSFIPVHHIGNRDYWFYKREFFF